jgi:hypothetical protein
MPVSDFTLETCSNPIEESACAAPIMDIVLDRRKAMTRSTSTSNIESMMSIISDITLPDTLACHKHKSHVRFDASPCRSDEAPRFPSRYFCQDEKLHSFPKQLDLSPQIPMRRERRMRSAALSPQRVRKTIHNAFMAIRSPSKHTSSAAMKAVYDADSTTTAASRTETIPSSPWK